MRAAATGASAGRLAALGVGGFALSWMMVAGFVAVGGDAAAGLTASGRQQPSAEAVEGIPPNYLDAYQAAGARYGIDWAVLAGIGEVECDHGRDPDPSCRQEGFVNVAGAGGPMQFLGSTWATYGVDGDGDGRRDRWDMADAIYAAANYLHASGAPADYRRAIFAYNHASWYVEAVLRWARKYRDAATAAPPEVEDGGSWAETLQTRTPTAVRMIAGPVARLSPGDGHLALIPAAAPAAVQAMIVAGNELQSVPYGPDGHPDPRNAPSQDCSSTVSYLLFRAGLRQISEIVRANPLAQDYTRWGAPGPGRWVTIFAAASPTPHVFAVVAGLRIDTSHNGTDVGPNRDQDGPRWRVLDGIPRWAHWSVRHPPGL